MRNFNRLKSKSSRGKQLRFESLEDRSMMAGNITAEVLAGTLFLGGDSKSNQVQVWQSGTNQWKVQGLGTKINGSNSIQTFSGVTDIAAILLQGDDYIRVFNGTLLGRLGISDAGDDSRVIKSNDVVQVSNIRADQIQIQTNDGNDNVLVQNSRALSDFLIKTDQTTSDGADVVTMLNTTLNSPAIIVTGTGADVVALNGVTSTSGEFDIITTFADNLDTSRDGNDSVSLINLRVQDNLFIETGAGNDILTISGLTANVVDIDLRNGNDVATLSNVRVSDSLGMTAGDGTDAITLTRVDARNGEVAIDMGAGNNDRLTIVQSIADTFDLDGGGNTGDTLVFVLNTYNSLQFTGFQHVIGV